MQNLTRAIEIVKSAVEEDEKKNYIDAYYLYCDGLQCFIPLIKAETDPYKYLHLQQRATTYMERAEEIQKSFKQGLLQRQQSQSNSNETQNESSSRSSERDVKQSSNPSSYKYLCMYEVFNLKTNI